MDNTKDTSVSLLAELKAATTAEQQVAIAQRAITALGGAETDLQTSVSQFNAKQSELDKANAELEKSENELAEALGTISDLGQKVDLMGKNQNPNQAIVNHNGKDHKLIGNRFVFPAIGTFTADELSKRPDLLDKMIATGSGALVELGTEPAASVV